MESLDLGHGHTGSRGVADLHTSRTMGLRPDLLQSRGIRKPDRTVERETAQREFALRPDQGSEHEGCPAHGQDVTLTEFEEQKVASLWVVPLPEPVELRSEKRRNGHQTLGLFFLPSLWVFRPHES